MACLNDSSTFFAINETVVANQNFSLFNLNTNSTNQINRSHSIVINIEPWKVELYKYFAPMLFIMYLLGVFGNFYVLLATRWIRKQCSPNLLFTISLTVADAWVSTILAIGLYVNSYLPFVHGQIVLGDYTICFSLGLEAIRTGAMVTTVYHLLALAFNHYLGIVKPLQYRAAMTKSNAMTIVTVLWIVPPFLLFTYFSCIPDHFFLSEKCAHYQRFLMFQFRSAVTAVIFVPLMLLTLIYVHIFVVIVRAKRKRVALGSFQGTSRRYSAEQRNIRAVVTTLLVVGSFVLCWVPAIINYVLFCIDCSFQISEHQLTVFWLSLLTNTLIALKCLGNPLIYAVRVNDIRRALLLMHACFRPGGQWISTASSVWERSSIVYRDTCNKVAGSNAPSTATAAASFVSHRTTLRVASCSKIQIPPATTAVTAGRAVRNGVGIFKKIHSDPCCTPSLHRSIATRNGSCGAAATKNLAELETMIVENGDYEACNNNNSHENNHHCKNGGYTPPDDVCL